MTDSKTKTYLAEMGSGKTRQLTGRAFQLESNSIGNPWILFPWAQYQVGEFLQNSEPQRLRLIFHVGVVEIKGYNLEVLIRNMQDEQCNRAAQHRKDEQIAMTDENETAPPEKIQAVITSVRTWPDFDDLFRERTEPPPDQP